MANPKNISIFEDTVDLVQHTKRLQDAVAASLRSQKFIAESDLVPDGRLIRRFETPAQIIVSKKRTFEAVSAYTGKGDKLCVLNFASATNPGDGSERLECAGRVFVPGLHALFYARYRRKLEALLQAAQNES